jgi:hypothetical protein
VRVLLGFAAARVLLRRWLTRAWCFVCCRSPCADELLEKALSRGELSAERVAALLDRYLTSQDPAKVAAAAAAGGTTGGTTGGNTTNFTTLAGGVSSAVGASAGPAAGGIPLNTTGFGAGHSGYVT